MIVDDEGDDGDDDEIQVMWGQGQLPPGSVPMWGPGMPGEPISLIFMYTELLMNICG